jgi:hypothetical protein
MKAQLFREAARYGTKGRYRLRVSEEDHSLFRHPPLPDEDRNQVLAFLQDELLTARRVLMRIDEREAAIEWAREAQDDVQQDLIDSLERVVTPRRSEPLVAYRQRLIRVSRGLRLPVGMR